MTREKAIKTLKEMPAEFNLEELIDRLILIEKVQAGVKQADEGKITPHEKVREITQKW